MQKLHVCFDITKDTDFLCLAQGLKHATCGAHVICEGILCGPRWFMEIFKKLTLKLF